jgi:hypothetical protein
LLSVNIKILQAIYSLLLFLNKVNLHFQSQFRDDFLSIKYKRSSNRVCTDRKEFFKMNMKCNKKTKKDVCMSWKAR